MSRLSEEYSSRKSKLETAKQLNINPYPARVERSKTIHQALGGFDRLSKEEEPITIVGRLKTIRLHGGSCFCHIDDGTEQFQLYFKKDIVGEDQYNQLKNLIDIGDFIQASGTLFNTKKGEKTLLIKSYKLIAKSLLPLPEKWHGLSDVEIRYRKRYLDLITNKEVKEIFRKRALILQTIRGFFESEGFIEVETPVLQPIPGGANAKPFITHHQALSTDLYLRIAPELYLKRLIVGGFEKVYEIARCFRNEGIDHDHNPEFTQVEFYAAYWDYEKMMEFTELLFQKIVDTLLHKQTLMYEKHKINFTPPFNRLNFKDACLKYAKIDIDSTNHKELYKQAKSKGLEIKSTDTRAKMLDEIFKELVRPNLIQPTFLIDHPIELSPLAKKKENNPKYVERFQLVIANMELCNAFSELNDPIDQEERFKAQEKMRRSGDEEAQRIDKDFIEALSHGMPPTAGNGIGIDRLTSLFNNVHNIKEVILFPTLKPKDNGSRQK